MSDNSIDASVLKLTQDILGKYIKKPPLSEKLLRKPPFRFLHDIVNVIIKETGYLKGLYNADELISDNIKDRDAKIKFLQSLIDVVKLSTNENITARPSKIVAGQEPEKTNELLQAIGRAIDKKIDSTQAIDTIKNGNGKTATTSAAPPPTTKTKVKSTGKVEKSEKVEKIERVVSNKVEKKKIENGTVAKNKSKENEKVSKPKDKIMSKDKEKKIENKMKHVTERRLNENHGLKKENSKIKRVSSTDDSLSMKSDLEKRIPPQPPPSANDKKINNVLGSIVENLEQPIANEKPIPKSKIENENDKAFKIVDTQESPSHPSSTEPELLNQSPNEPLTNGDSHSINVEDHKIELRKQKQQESHHNIKNSSAKIKSRRNSTDELAAIIDEEADRRRNEKNERRSTKSNKSRRPSETDDSLAEFVKAEQTVQNTIPQHESDAPNNKSQPSYIHDKSTTNNRPRTSLRPPSVRPASARPGAPRRRDRNVDIILQPDQMVKLGEIKVKIENMASELEDDGENLVIIEDQDNLTKNESILSPQSNELSEEAQQGHLVQQILETQKEFIDNSIEGQTNIDKEWDKTRQSSAKQVDSLREALQKLTRSVNPLGKLLDFLQEDIDSMDREFEMWRDNYRQTRTELNREKGLTETAIEPVKHQLAEMDGSIREYVELINRSRASILQNEQKNFNLLTE